MEFLAMTSTRHFQSQRSVIFVLQIALLGMLRGSVVEGQVSVHVDVTLRNRMDSGEVVSMDCMLNDTSINPKGFLNGGASSGSSDTSSSLGVISEDMTQEDGIFCDFRLGFVAKGFVQVAVQCSAVDGCSPLAVDFTNQGVYFNLSDWSQPSGLPDLPWSTLLPSLPHS